MTADTTGLKVTMAEVQRDLRDRPARKLMLTGGWCMGVGVIGAVAIITLALPDPALSHVRETLNPAALSLALLGAVLFAGGAIMRQHRVSQEARTDELSREIRDARPADAVELARLVALHEATQAQLRQLGTTVNLMGGALQRKFDAVIDCAVDANDEAFVDALSKQEDRPKTNGHKAVRLVRPRTYDDDRHGR